MVNQQHSTISSPMPLTVQLPKGSLISPCNFPIGLSAFTQNHSSPSNLQRLSEVERKCFDPGGMTPLLYFPISSVFLSVQFPSRVSLPIPLEPPDSVAFQKPSLNLFMSFTTTEHIAAIRYSYLHLFPMSLTVLQLFDEMPMSQVVICNVITSRRAYKGLEVVEFELYKEWNSMDIVPPNYTLFIMRWVYTPTHVFK
ncbi:hypothetical protein TSUD_352040 [Trifolium subterraneum]|nr:hypothetical protein TSUD_352040 [Trifolium subterraneum]